MSNSNPQLRIKLLNLVLNDIRSRGWTNYDNFAQVLVEHIVTNAKNGDLNLGHSTSKSPTAFFRLNSISRRSFPSPELARNIEAAVEEEFGQGNTVDSGTAARLLEGMTEVRLSQYRISGDYIRYDERARHLLKDFKHRMLASFNTPKKGHENYLIWATPGSGKTFFVKQLALDTKSMVRFYEFNLASMTEAELQSGLSESDRTPGPALCFIDEIDSKPNYSWPYGILLASLDARTTKERPRVFVMAGSSGSSLVEMKTHMIRAIKGKDLLSRIPYGNELEIPPLTIGDKTLLTLGSIRNSGEEVGRPITEVEKLAVYFMTMKTELDSPRKLREFAIRSVERIPSGEDRMKYDNLFEPGDELSKEFWMRAKSLVPKLINSFIRVDQ